MSTAPSTDAPLRRTSASAYPIPLSALVATVTAMVTGMGMAMIWIGGEPGRGTLAVGIVLIGLVITIFALGRSFQRRPQEVQVLPVEDQRSKALAVLAAGLAHELGQPLSAARVGVEGLHYLRQLGRDPSPAHLEQTLCRIGLSLVAMTQTIEHLKGLASAEPAARERLDLVGTVDAVLAERSDWLRYQDADLSWTPPTAAIPVLADAAGLRMILANLVRNAVEAVAGLDAAQRRIVINVGPGPQLQVIDHGPGTPADLLGRVFDPFHSSKLGAWRGIGLSLAQASARRMGAHLVVESTVGVGTTFTLRLEAA